MTRNAAPLLAAENMTHAIADHLGFLAEAQPARAPDVGIGTYLCSGFARDFVTADGHRVMVAALTRRQFADLAAATRLADTFAFLERVLHADFTDLGDMYTHRAAIAVLLASWFARRTVLDLDAAFAGTSVLWARLHNLTGRPEPRH